MKWIKHYGDAHTNKVLEHMLSHKNGHEMYALYWLLLEYLVKEFKKDTKDFIVPSKKLCAALFVKYDRKVERFLQVLSKFASSLDQDLFKFEVISEKDSPKIYKIYTPIVLELMGKEFKRTRQKTSDESFNPPPKNIRSKEKKEAKKNISGKPDVATKIIEHLNRKTGKKFKPNSQATLRKINARLREKFKLPDFYAVIDFKTSQWLDDPRMNEYLRPDTLFNTKFESYLQAAKKSIATSQKFESLFHKPNPEQSRLDAEQIINEVKIAQNEGGDE